MFLDVTTVQVTNDVTAALLNALYPVFLTTLTAVIGFVGNEVRKWVKANATNSQVDAFQKFAVIGVQAAEQIFGAAEGEQKFAYAKAYVEAELAKRGVKVDADQIQSVIEAAVLEQFNWPEATPSEPGALGETEVILPPDPQDDGDEFSTGDHL